MLKGLKYGIIAALLFVLATALLPPPADGRYAQWGAALGKTFGPAVFFLGFVIGFVRRKC